MIQVQDLVDLMEFELDAEGSDRYLFETDYKPAINSAMNWLVSVFNKAFEQNKLVGENLRDLVKTRVWVANNFSRIKFDEAIVNEKLWSFLAVWPEPVVYPTQTPPTLPNDYTSIFMPDVAFVSSKYSAGKLTVEKWNENFDNVFEVGNDSLQNGLKTYAYLTDIDYSTDTTYLEDKEITIRPDVSGQFVAMVYLKIPNDIDTVNDFVEFPETLRTLIVQKSLNFISIKQGDNTTLFQVTQNDVNTLLQLMN